MIRLAVAISYSYEFMSLLGHAWMLFKLRERRHQEAYAHLQETLTDVDEVQQIYKALKKAEAQLINSELSLGFTQRAHLDTLRAAITRIRQRARENTPDLATAA